MAYRKSYYEQRVDEQARIREAVQQQILRQQEEAAAEPVVEEVPAPEVDLPTAEWTKVAIQAWLDDNDIEWSSSMTKAELLTLIN